MSNYNSFWDYKGASKQAEFDRKNAKWKNDMKGMSFTCERIISSGAQYWAMQTDGMQIRLWQEDIAHIEKSFGITLGASLTFKEPLMGIIRHYSPKWGNSGLVFLEHEINCFKADLAGLERPVKPLIQAIAPQHAPRVIPAEISAFNLDSLLTDKQWQGIVTRADFHADFMGFSWQIEIKDERKIIQLCLYIAKTWGVTPCPVIIKTPAISRFYGSF